MITTYKISNVFMVISLFSYDLILYRYYNLKIVIFILLRRNIYFYGHLILMIPLIWTYCLRLVWPYYRKTLEGRSKKNNPIKEYLRLGSTLGFENERRLFYRIHKVKSMGVSITRSDLWTIVFKFSQHLKYKFNKEKQKAGCHFVSGFLDSNQDMKFRK